MSIHVCKCERHDRPEFHLRYPGMTEQEAQRLADRINGGCLNTGWVELTPTTRPEPEVFVLTWDGKTVGVDWFGSLLRPSGTNYTHWMPFPAPPSAGAMYGMHSLQASA